MTNENKKHERAIESIAAKVLATHDSHPEAQSIAGSVLNGGNNSTRIISKAHAKAERGTATPSAMKLAKHVKKTNQN